MRTCDDAGATRSWLHSTSWSMSFALVKKGFKSTEVFYLDDRKNAQRWQSNTNWRHERIHPDAWKGMVPWTIDLLLYNRPVLADFLWFLIHCIWDLSISVFLCAKFGFGCSWFVVQNWRIPQQNGNLLLRIGVLHGIIILSLRTELIERSVLLIHSDTHYVNMHIAGCGCHEISDQSRSSQGYIA